MDKKLVEVVDRHIRNTPKKGYVKDLRIKIGGLSQKLKPKLKAKNLNIYVTTKSLKHMYDVRSAQEFDFIVENVSKVINSPYKIFKNKDGKTGDICFYFEIDNSYYFLILEVNQTGIYLVSAYKLSDIETKRKNYLSGYKLLWSWKVDLPSS